MSHRALLLFDVDMTLLSSAGAGMEAMRVVGQRLFGEGFSFEGVDPAGALDPLLFSQAMEANGVPDGPAQRQRFHDAYVRQLPVELASRRDRVLAKPGVHDLLAMLCRRAADAGDVILGVLTGNYEQGAAVKLAAVGIDVNWFAVRVFGGDANDRPALVELAMQRYTQRFGQTIDPHHVIIIGDTPRDIAAAKAHGCRCLAVGTGRFTVEQLRSAGADVAIENLSDPQPLLDMIDQRLTGVGECITQ